MIGGQVPLLAPDPGFRDLWVAEAVRGPWAGACNRCGRTTDDDGRPLLVARRARERRFLCLACFVETRRRRRR